MKLKKLATAVAGTTFMVGIAGVPPAWAIDNIQALGIEERVDGAGGEIGYTVTKLMPSADVIPYPVNGQLYEATVMANAVSGSAAPVVPFFNARSEGGQSYPVLVDVFTPQGLSGAPLPPGGSTTGKIYFDVVGEPPNSVVYNDGSHDLLGWVTPPGNGAPITGGSGSTDGGTSGGAGGSQGVTGSTGPMQASPNTSGGEGGGGGGVEGSDAGGGGLGGAPGGAAGGGAGGAAGGGG